MRKFFPILSLVCLALVASLILFVEVSADRPRAFARKLAEVVPDSVEGWRVETIPVASTPGVEEAVNKVLRHDDIIQRMYARDDLQVLVYAAYWSPGKVTTVDAGSHNPDSCWVASGMKRSERLYSQSADIGSRPLLPFEYGEYSKSGVVQHVLFWHLVQGVPQNYVDQKEGWRNGILGRLDRLPLVWADIKKYGLNQKREQLFVRISCNKPFSEVKHSPAFHALLGAVSGLGVFKDTAWSEGPSKP